MRSYAIPWLQLYVAVPWNLLQLYILYYSYMCNLLELYILYYLNMWKHYIAVFLTKSQTKFQFYIIQCYFRQSCASNFVSTVWERPFPGPLKECFFPSVVWKTWPACAESLAPAPSSTSGMNLNTDCEPGPLSPGISAGPHQCSCGWTGARLQLLMSSEKSSQKKSMAADSWTFTGMTWWRSHMAVILMLSYCRCRWWNKLEFVVRFSGFIIIIIDGAKMFF